MVASLNSRLESNKEEEKYGKEQDLMGVRPKNPKP